MPLPELFISAIEKPGKSRIDRWAFVQGRDWVFKPLSWSLPDGYTVRPCEPLRSRPNNAGKVIVVFPENMTTNGIVMFTKNNKGDIQICVATPSASTTQPPERPVAAPAQSLENPVATPELTTQPPERPVATPAPTTQLSERPVATPEPTTQPPERPVATPAQPLENPVATPEPAPTTQSSESSGSAPGSEMKVPIRPRGLRSREPDTRPEIIFGLARKRAQLPLAVSARLLFKDEREIETIIEDFRASNQGATIEQVVEHLAQIIRGRGEQLPDLEPKNWFENIRLEGKEFWQYLTKHGLWYFITKDAYSPEMDRLSDTLSTEVSLLNSKRNMQMYEAQKRQTASAPFVRIIEYDRSGEEWVSCPKTRIQRENLHNLLEILEHFKTRRTTTVEPREVKLTYGVHEVDVLSNRSQEDIDLLNSRLREIWNLCGRFQSDLDRELTVMNGDLFMGEIVCQKNNTVMQEDLYRVDGTSLVYRHDLAHPNYKAYELHTQWDEFETELSTWVCGDAEEEEEEGSKDKLRKLFHVFKIHAVRGAPNDSDKLLLYDIRVQSFRRLSWFSVIQVMLQWITKHGGEMAVIVLFIAMLGMMLSVMWRNNPTGAAASLTLSNGEAWKFTAPVNTSTPFGVTEAGSAAATGGAWNLTVDTSTSGAAEQEEEVGLTEAEKRLYGDLSREHRNLKLATRETARGLNETNRVVTETDIIMYTHKLAATLSAGENPYEPFRDMCGGVLAWYSNTFEEWEKEFPDEESEVRIGALNSEQRRSLGYLNIGWLFKKQCDDLLPRLAPCGNVLGFTCPKPLSPAENFELTQNLVKASAAVRGDVNTDVDNLATKLFCLMNGQVPCIPETATYNSESISQVLGQIGSARSEPQARVEGEVVARRPPAQSAVTWTRSWVRPVLLTNGKSFSIANFGFGLVDPTTPLTNLSLVELTNRARELLTTIRRKRNQFSDQQSRGRGIILLIDAEGLSKDELLEKYVREVVQPSTVEVLEKYVRTVFTATAQTDWEVKINSTIAYLQRIPNIELFDVRDVSTSMSELHWVVQACIQNEAASATETVQAFNICKWIAYEAMIDFNALMTQHLVSLEQMFYNAAAAVGQQMPVQTLLHEIGTNFLRINTRLLEDNEKIQELIDTDRASLGLSSSSRFGMKLSTPFTAALLASAATLPETFAQTHESSSLYKSRAATLAVTGLVAGTLAPITYSFVQAAREPVFKPTYNKDLFIPQAQSVDDVRGRLQLAEQQLQIFKTMEKKAWHQNFWKEVDLWFKGTYSMVWGETVFEIASKDAILFTVLEFYFVLIPRWYIPYKASVSTTLYTGFFNLLWFVVFLCVNFVVLASVEGARKQLLEREKFNVVQTGWYLTDLSIRTVGRYIQPDLTNLYETDMSQYLVYVLRWHLFAKSGVFIGVPTIPNLLNSWLLRNNTFAHSYDQALEKDLEIAKSKLRDAMRSQKIEGKAEAIEQASNDYLRILRYKGWQEWWADKSSLPTFEEERGVQGGGGSFILPDRDLEIANVKFILLRMLTSCKEQTEPKPKPALIAKIDKIIKMLGSPDIELSQIEFGMNLRDYAKNNRQDEGGKTWEDLLKEHNYVIEQNTFTRKYMGKFKPQPKP